MLARTRRIRAVEAIEDSLHMLRRDAFACIRHREKRIVMMLFEGERNRSLRLRVFDGIVQENHDHLLDLLTVAVQGQIGFNLIMQRNIFLEHNGLHCENDAFDGFAHVEVREDHTCPGVIHFG